MCILPDGLCVTLWIVFPAHTSFNVVANIETSITCGKFQPHQIIRMNTHQTTLATSVSIEGPGLHSGRPARITLRPAAPGSGVRFQRTDMGGPIFAADFRQVQPSDLQTTLACGEARVETTEHLMAALAALEVDNALIELTGPEVPIVDGSALPFVRLIQAAGLEAQNAGRAVARITRPFSYSEGARHFSVEPADETVLSCDIDFPYGGIGAQSYAAPLSDAVFVREIAHAKTFCAQDQVDAMQAAGKALGGHGGNAMIFGPHSILNPQARRYIDDPARHKLLDLVGDLALLGRPLLGRIAACRPGHAFTNRALRALVASGSLA